jgi:hypothetical protein
MIRPLLAAALLLGAVHAGPALAAKDGSQVIVQDPYLEFRSGPGRGYPVFHVVDRGDSVTLLRRRTDWIKVRDRGGQQGWVYRGQLERTLTPGGEPVTIPAPSPEARQEHRWELGLATGDFGGASLVSVRAAYALTRTLFLRTDVAQLLGDYSDGWLASAGVAHAFAPQWRVSPFIGIGGGVLRIEPKATLVRPEDRTEQVVYAGGGLRGYLTNRFLLEAQYRSIVVLTSRDENEETDEWTLAFTYFF